jgi:hypothetical protein
MIHIFTKRFIIFTFSFLITLGVFPQQIFRAGDKLTTYSDFNPDISLQNNCGWVNYYDQNYSFDLDGDLQNDVVFNTHCAISPGVHQNFTLVKSLNPNVFFKVGYVDSAYYPSYIRWAVYKSAAPLLFNDTINSQGSEWDTLIYIDLSFSLWNNPSVYINKWKNVSTDQYLGLVYYHGSDTLYGWVRLFMDTQIVIKDFSIGSSLIGIDEVNENYINIYPNPASNKIFIEQKQFQQCDIILQDLLGRQLLSKKITDTRKSEIDISNLNNGIYLLTISSKQNQSTKKIVVQR